ncbi:MAG: hypothetical protein ACI9XU_001865 [Arenicella sp.]|jgi:hypothetical protein
MQTNVRTIRSLRYAKYRSADRALGFHVNSIISTLFCFCKTWPLPVNVSRLLLFQGSVYFQVF